MKIKLALSLLLLHATGANAFFTFWDTLFCNIPIIGLFFCDHCVYNDDPCGEGGTCQNKIGAYGCICEAGWTGTNCERENQNAAVDACNPNPCFNFGDCRDGADGGFTCKCPPGFKGDRCETKIIDLCDPNPCENGGSCSFQEGDSLPSCLCRLGFNGKTCQKNINECDPNPCQNGASCVDGIYGYNCTCLSGFSGDQCDVDDGSAAATSMANQTTTPAPSSTTVSPIDAMPASSSDPPTVVTTKSPISTPTSGPPTFSTTDSPISAPTSDPPTLAPIKATTVVPTMATTTIFNPNEVAKLTASNGNAYDYFGWSVAIDGDTLVIGGYGDDDNGQRSGSANVFIRSGTVGWTEQAKLIAFDGAASDEFGRSVAIHGDTVVVSARDDDDNTQNSGSVHIFIRTGTAWSQQAKLVASDGAAGDRFGRSVAMDVDTLVIGAYRDDNNGGDSGSAYVYTRSGATWTEQARLMANDGAADDEFGTSVAIVGDTIVVGAPRSQASSSGNGSVYVFIRTDNIWSQQTKLVAGDVTAQDQFGQSVAMDDSTLVVGAHWDDDNGIESGSVYIFNLSGGEWIQQAKLTASDGDGDDRFGNSVAISGESVVIGAPGFNGSGSNSGSAYIFVLSNSTWTEQFKWTASDSAENDLFGWSVAISGESVVVGAYQDDDDGENRGSAYILDLLP